jgi:ribosome-associated toxin RatA of RatAB toxin-antitoxin module
MTPLDAHATDTPGWVPVAVTRAGSIYHRDFQDSAVPMIMIATTFAAEPARVHAVVTDYDRFAEFVPNVLESRVLARRGADQWVFHHLRFAGPVADRAYVIRSSDVRRSADTGYRVEWRLSRRQFPGVDVSAGIRPRRLSGFWELRPAAHGAATEACYAVHSDPGGFIPAWLVARMSDRYVQQVIEAVGQRLRGDSARHLDYPQVGLNEGEARPGRSVGFDRLGPSCGL